MALEVSTLDKYVNNREAFLALPGVKDRLNKMSTNLGVSVQEILSVIQGETAGSFSTKQTNLAGSGATGLIQFMPDKGKNYKTIAGKRYKISDISEMNELQQLDLVEKHVSSMFKIKPEGSSVEPGDFAKAVGLPVALKSKEDFDKWKTNNPTQYQNALNANKETWAAGGNELTQDGISNYYRQFGDNNPPGNQEQNNQQQNNQQPQSYILNGEELTKEEFRSRLNEIEDVSNLEFTINNDDEFNTEITKAVESKMGDEIDQGKRVPIYGPLGEITGYETQMPGATENQLPEIYEQSFVEGNAQDGIDAMKKGIEDGNFRTGEGMRLKLQNDVILNGENSKYWEVKDQLFQPEEIVVLEEDYKGGIKGDKNRADFQISSDANWLAQRQYGRDYNQLTQEQRNNLKQDEYAPTPEYIEKIQNKPQWQKKLQEYLKVGKVWNKTYDEDGNKVYVDKPPVGSLEHRSMEWKRPGYKGFVPRNPDVPSSPVLSRQTMDTSENLEGDRPENVNLVSRPGGDSPTEQGGGDDINQQNLTEEQRRALQRYQERTGSTNLNIINPIEQDFVLDPQDEMDVDATPEQEEEINLQRTPVEPTVLDAIDSSIPRARIGIQPNTPPPVINESASDDIPFVFTDDMELDIEDDIEEETETDEELGIKKPPPSGFDKFKKFMGEKGLGLLAQAAITGTKAALGLESLERARETIPTKDIPGLSRAWESHMQKMKEISQSGLTAQEKFSMKTDLSKAYNMGIRNSMRASGGSRATFLANAGVLNANRVGGLLKLGAMDAATRRKNMEMYGGMLKFQEKARMDKGIIDAKMDYEEARRTANIEGAIGSQLIGSAINDVNYYMQKIANNNLDSSFTRLANLKNIDDENKYELSKEKSGFEGLSSNFLENVNKPN
jgi:hypothetical protein|tara:strand:+ start:14757 stop:17447 length:2691 start_codon:yes stop_codon:yes gene_type:complete